MEDGGIFLESPVVKGDPSSERGEKKEIPFTFRRVRHGRPRGGMQGAGVGETLWRGLADWVILKMQCE
jgi:hypothetical protein